MKAIPLLAVMLWLPALLCGQAYPVTTAVTLDSNGVGQVRVKNNGSSPLTGFMFIYTLHRTLDGPAYGASNGFYDSTTDSYAEVVPPGKEVLLPFRIGGNGFTPKVSAGAGIFADGTSFGEKVTVQRIIDRRNYMLVSFNKSISDLTQDNKQGFTREQMIMQFQLALNQETAAGLNPDLVECIQNVRGMVIETLRSARQPDGSATPVQSLVDSLLETLKSRRDILKKALS
jgi:hypothetical protein